MAFNWLAMVPITLRMARSMKAARHTSVEIAISPNYSCSNSNSGICLFPHFPVGALRYRGGPHLSYVFHGRRGLFLRPPHVRDFVKEGYFFVPRYEVWGSKSPYNPRNIRGSDAE